MQLRFVLVALAVGSPLLAQQRAITAADYARAERFMAYNTTPLVFGNTVRPTWLAGDRFWYRNTTPTAAELVVIDPAGKTRKNLLGEPALAGAITAGIQTTADALRQTTTQIELK